MLFVIYHNSNSHIRGNFGGCDLLLVLLPQHTSIETCEAMGGLVVYVPPAVVWLVCHHETCGDGLSYRSCCPQNQGGSARTIVSNVASGAKRDPHPSPPRQSQRR